MISGLFSVKHWIILPMWPVILSVKLPVTGPALNRIGSETWNKPDKSGPKSPWDLPVKKPIFGWSTFTWRKCLETPNI